jgi:hypothetical protein
MSLLNICYIEMKVTLKIHEKKKKLVAIFLTLFRKNQIGKPKPETTLRQIQLNRPKQSLPHRTLNHSEPQHIM